MTARPSPRPRKPREDVERDRWARVTDEARRIVMRVVTFRGGYPAPLAEFDIVKLVADEVRRAERRARSQGKALGYVAVAQNYSHVVEPTIRRKPWRSAIIGSRCARVVLVPRKAGRRG